MTMNMLVKVCARCHHKFVDVSYKYCPMCGTRRLSILVDNSSTDEASVELGTGINMPRNLPIPTYEQIYVHHPRSLKEDGKLYGKKFLSTYYIDEYYKFMNNQQKAKLWLKKGGFRDHNRGGNREEWRSAVKAICEARYKDMELLDFNKIQMPWRPKEIYNYLVEHTENFSKYSKTKLKKLAEVSLLINSILTLYNCISHIHIYHSLPSYIVIKIQ